MGNHPYRWVVLAVTLAVNATIQLLWVAYAAVMLDAQRFFGVSTTAVGVFSMVFMVAFIPLSLPASWLIGLLGGRGEDAGIGPGGVRGGGPEERDSARTHREGQGQAHAGRGGPAYEGRVVLCANAHGRSLQRTNGGRGAGRGAAVGRGGAPRALDVVAAVRPDDPMDLGER